MYANFKGKEAHAAAFPWDGRNALDAAVSAYQNIALLRQHVRPACRIHAIITKGGTVPNIIPADARLEMYVRAPTKTELENLEFRTRECVESGARAAGCSVHFENEEGTYYANLVTNEVMADIYQKWAARLGLHEGADGGKEVSVGSTDMGNVSHCVPSIHPFYRIPTDAANHSIEFTEAAGAAPAQGPTLAAAKAMAMTALTLMRMRETIQLTKKKFEEDLKAGK